ncbi:MAG: hypothetical protein JSU85_13945 [Candidatus Zixiibacteriota bacterium]|nr:MAG: hypothetical protein JSU85_13945 [candidate division Zixibacteria bacterium]
MSARILVSPGIGDIHFVALKLRSFCDKNGLGLPEIWVWNFDGRPRSLEFVERLEFAVAGGYLDSPLTGYNKIVFRDCYLLGSKEIEPGLFDLDYFICPNGRLRTASDYEKDIMPEYDVDWHYEIKRTDREIEFGESFRKRGEYVLLYFSDNHMFKQWLRIWGIESIIRFIREIHRVYPELRLILTGSWWDRNFSDQLMAAADFPLENMVGQTDFDQFIGLIRYARAFAGWCGGNTIISTHLRKPTYVLWCDYFKDVFCINWVPKDIRGETYFWDKIESISPEQAARKFVSALEIREER